MSARIKTLSGILFLSSQLLLPGLQAQVFLPRKTSIYHDGWIDLNKNGRKDIYEDPTQPIDRRIEDLLGQMTLEEKTCQTATLYGYHRVLKDSLPTTGWKNEIWKDGIANIDEHLNGFTGWDQPVPDLAIIKEIGPHVLAMNLTQEFFIEDTRLGIPADFTNEGIRGVEAYGATSFPTPLALGATWDQELVRNIGRITGSEARAMGYTNVYAPVLDVARDQRWGRLEESYGESPYLVSRMGAELAKGMQENHQVASTAKHYALYSANFGAREGMARTDPQMPPREVETLLLPPFETVIKEAQILGVMASYNDYDGVPVIGSHYWLTQRLREDFGFKGYVVSDSDALEYLVNKHHVAKDQEDAVVQAINAGMNVRTNFSGPETMILPLRKAVREGKVTMKTLNDRVRDVLRVKFITGQFDHPYIKDVAASTATMRDPRHKEVSLRASRECIVLLKNEKNILPLSKNLHSIAIIGPNADDAGYVHQHYGPRGVDGVTVLQGIKDKLGDKVAIHYAKGCELVDSHWPESEVLPQPPTGAEEAMMDSAVDIAREADVTVMVMGGSTKTAGEDKSRTSLDLPGYQLALIQKVAATGKPVVVVFINSQPITFNWVDRFIPGILEAGYPGPFGGTAIADVLFGDYNPGGKLTVTFPRSVGQLPMNFPSKPLAQTDEGEKARLKGKLYPFGYGLSYTHFEYSALQVREIAGLKGFPDGSGSADGSAGEGLFTVSFTIANTGAYAGDEVAQLYLHENRTDVTTYEKNLRGFKRVHLAPGESKQVSFTLKKDDLAIWNRDMHFVVEPGEFSVMVGASSEDIRLKGSFSIPADGGFLTDAGSRRDTTFFYISKTGSSANDGSKEHPFASLEDAKKAIRQLKSGHGGLLPLGGVTIRLRGGFYELPTGFVLDKDDSGTEESPIIFTAFPGEKVILSGGKRMPTADALPISTDAAGRIIDKEAVAHIREIDLRGLGISDYGIQQVTGFRRPYVNAAMELFINGRPYHLARYPDDKKILIDTGDVVDNGIAGRPGAIRFDKKRLALWSQAKEIVAAGNFSRAWATDQLRVKNFDARTGVVHFADAHYFGISGGKEWNQYYYFNLLEELSKPGEYYIDRGNGQLYFYPLEPLQPADTILVSRLEDALVSLKGVSHITFNDIQFEDGRGIGIYMENTVSNRIMNCTIRNMGTVGVCIGKGSLPAREYRLPDPFNPMCPDEKLSGRLGSLHELLYENTVFNRDGGKDNGVINCSIENMGCGGVSLGGGDRLTLEPAGNYVYNCEFTNCGRIDYSYKSPVNIDGVGNRVQHCLFNASPATAIYIHGNNHLIEFNEIRDACNFVDDQAAIYIGRDPSEFGNTIRWNFFHDIGHFGTTMAVYFDDGACGTEVYGNVFYKAGDRTIFVGGGSYNHIYNNILVDSKMAFHLDDRLSNWQKKALEPGGLLEYRLNQVNYKQPPYANAYPGLAGYFEHHPEIPQHNDIENNVLVHIGVLNSGKKEWGPIHDDNFITDTDPGFVNAAEMNFALKEDAEVFKQLPGFKAIPFSSMGLIDKLAQPVHPGQTFVPKDSGWKKLSIRQKIGQTMLMLPDRDLELRLGGGSLAAFFKKYPVGGFFMGWKLWDGVAPADRLAHIRKRSLEYQAASELPLVFQEDYESGVDIPGMISFPNEMTLGAAGSPQLAYDYGKAVAQESKSVGVNWVLHPVADLNLNPLNPIMNIRSIGDDPDRAIRFLARQIKGLQDNGVAATIKHFPGDGVDFRDQHLVTSCNSLSFADWKQKHGKVFQALIDSGVACIMPGHITLPAYQKERLNGFFPPATLSKELLTGLLKGEMGFRGVIVSDAMTMGGFRGYYDDPLEGEIHSFLAGVDVLLWPSYRFMDTVEARINRGEIPMARLDDAVQRVWALKERFGLLSQKREVIVPVPSTDKERATATADAICEQAITLVRDRQHALPLSLTKDKKILVVGVAPVGRKGGDRQLEGIRFFAQALRDRGFQVDFRHNILYETQGWTDDAPEKYDRILVVVARAPHAPFGPLQLSDDEAQSAWAINSMPKEKIIVLNLGSPYLTNEYFYRVNTCINAYSNTPVMHKAVIKALLGEIPIKGVSPVDIDAEPRRQGYAEGDDTLSSLRECRIRQGLPNLFKKLLGGQPVTVAYLGGSITNAEGGYRDQSLSWLRQQYPGAKITGINAGVGGTASDLADFRLGKQVLAYKPDLVFVGFAVNDQIMSADTVHATMEGIVRQIWKQDPHTDICFLYTMTGDMFPVLKKGQLPATARAMEDIADRYGIPSIDLCLEITALAAKGALVFKGKQVDYPGKMVFSADNVHPYAETGHRLYTEAIARSFALMASDAKILAHPLVTPFSSSAIDWENCRMLGVDQLKRTGRWEKVIPAKAQGGPTGFTPAPFPVLLKSLSPDASLHVQFEGTMVGLFDLVGPGTGAYDVIIDDQPAKTYRRFDGFAGVWRSHYFLVTGMPPGKHKVEFRVSRLVPDKRSLLGNNARDLDLHPEKYAENACYAGYLLVEGK